VRTAADARLLIEERGLTHVKVGLTDVDGVLRGKYLHRDKFLGILESGFGFCDVVLGWDSNDQMYDNVAYTGWHTAYPDAPVRVVLDSCRELPFEHTLFFLLEFAAPADQLCPRGLLRRTIAKANAMGFEPYSALEYEFFVFEETPQSVRAKNYRDLKPITPGNFGYSVLRSSVHSEFYHELLALAEAMDFPIESLHTETGAGVLEAAIGVDKSLASADKAALFKTFTKVLAQRRGWMATFMAKWSRDWPGQSGHLHLSLKDAFHDPQRPHGMSEVMEHFVAGLQQLLPEFLAMVAPTINSYTRMIPGFWAPTHATWGVENRTCALRVIPGSAKSQRVEFRIGAADGNPYLVSAAALAAGLWGITEKIPLALPITGNSYAVKHADALALPSTLWDAAQRLKHSAVARSLFGDAFVDHYVATREWEEREYRKQITDWQLQRYFEII
jgi:glutamine synthetase